MLDGKAEQFIEAYIEAMIFTETPDDSRLERVWQRADFADEAKRQIVKDCLTFIEDVPEFDTAYGYEIESMGHDFWLTRNGHGSGFWDGDWPEKEGVYYTKLSEKAGISAVYLSRGKLYVTNW